MSARETTLALRLHGRAVMSLALLVLAMMALGHVGSGNPASAAAPSGLNARSAQPANKIDPFVAQDLASMGTASLVIRMADKADLSAAYGMKDHDARGWYVYNTLRDHAARTQTGVRAFLDARGTRYESYWGANVIIADGNRELVEALAARADVERIESNRPFKGIDPIESTPSDKGSADAPDGDAIGIAWGVQNVRAPEVWDEGYRGAGIVIGNQDTGMRWTHTAIKGQYRGWDGATANHNYNWWDGLRVPGDLPTNPCGYSSEEPCDDDELLGGGHGTHTTGTVLGDDGMGNQVGVAPEAEWIGCRNMERGVGRPQTYMECFEFFLAPHDLAGENPDPTKRPHVMNNSWICIEGCAPDTLQDLVEASQASGIFVEVSAGNDGPTCSTIQFPPQIYEASFDTGSINVDAESGLPYVSDFSSRGPVLSDGSMRLKPNVVAPGEDIPSALRGSDTEYDTLSGTSMAGPHTVGVVALIWSARPELVRQITETKVLLQMSANPDVHVIDPLQECGGTTEADIPNNHFGWGRVDAFAALQRAQGVVPTTTPVVSPTPGTPTVTPTVCPIQFADVPADHTFYPFVRCLSCRHIIGGYPCGGTNPDTDQAEPCNTGGQPYYRPGSNVTRGQIAKIVAESYGYSDEAGPQVYQDVEPGDPFYVWINRLTRDDVMNGYPCGGPGEPCEEGSKPYFRPAAYATRGQLAKIVANAARFREFHSNQVFEDVPLDHPFYRYIAPLASRQIMSGYPCGGTNPDTGEQEPCDETNRPYFRPASNVTRGQTAKIVANAAFPNCNTP